MLIEGMGLWEVGTQCLVTGLPAILCCHVETPRAHCRWQILTHHFSQVGGMCFTPSAGPGSAQVHFNTQKDSKFKTDLDYI